MKYGILADIHGDVTMLRRALDTLQSHAVDLHIVLGDAIYNLSHADETADLLRACHAVGVWGNHDLALCCDPTPELVEQLRPATRQFLQTLTARHVTRQTCFSHTFPHLNAADPLAYYESSHRDLSLQAANSFQQVEQRILMIGHFHRWSVVTPQGNLAWRADSPLELTSPQRYLVVVGAVMDGWTAVFDESENLLMPIRL